MRLNDLGAFDKVYKVYLLAKLYRAGIGDEYLQFSNAYLDHRYGYVAVGNELSDKILLQDMVFQGTVLGPTLWNVFFADISRPATSKLSSICCGLVKAGL